MLTIAVSDVAAAVAALAALVAASAPLAGLTALQLAALQAQARSVVALIDQAAAQRGAVLDGADPAGFVGTFPAALLALGVDVAESRRLSDMRGLVGRALLNLQQAG